MLIYNFQKEFLGIDEKDLRTLGFKDLSGLRAEVTDFADLFVKTPGYVHNFKHVHWIDFITCADSNEESKVVINVNNKNFKCVIQISTAYLVDNPSSKAYLVNLHNLRELSAKESESISGDITQRQAPQTQAEATPIFNTPDQAHEDIVEEIQFADETPTNNVTVDPYESPLEVNFDNTDDALPVDAYDDTENLQEEKLEIADSFEDATPTLTQEKFEAPLSIELEESALGEEDETVSEVPQEMHSHIEQVVENYDNGYTYDPHVASDELGLPIDLIEEFIQDFIQQAKEFKEGLYKSLDENDLDNLKILSHKLKGVAANLRIEDALDTLTIVNTSADINVIKENLDTFYKIIAKLAGEEIVVEKEVKDIPITPIEKEAEADNDSSSLDLDFKEDDDDLYSDPVAIEDVVEDEIKIDLEEPLDVEADEDEIKIDLEEPLDVEADEDEIKIDLEEPLEIEAEDDEIKVDLEEPLEVQADEDEIKIDLEEPLEVEEDEIVTVNYSKEKIASEIGLDQESFNELFSDYIQEAKEASQAIKNSITNSNFQKCRDEAIKLKGMSDSMHIDTYSKELEVLIHSSDELELTHAIKTVDAAIAQLSKIGV